MSKSYEACEIDTDISVEFRKVKLPQVVDSRGTGVQEDAVDVRMFPHSPSANQCSPLKMIGRIIILLGCKFGNLV